MATKKRTVIDLTLSSDEEDERPRPGPSRVARPVKASSTSAPFLSDRARMEQERLERQKVALANGATTIKVTDTSDKRTKLSTMADVSDAKPDKGTGKAPKWDKSSRFWQGKIMRVSNRHVQVADSMSFDDVLGDKDKMQAGIISSMAWSEEWVFEKMPQKAHLLWIMHKSESKGAALNRIDKDVHPNLFMIAPKLWMNDYACMHFKCFILFFKDYVRIAIPTANAFEFDWTDMDNVLYIQDFKKKASTSNSGSEEEDENADDESQTDFSVAFTKYLKRLGVTKEFMKLFDKFDFSTSSDIQFVWSTHGTWKGWKEAEKGGGLISLARAVKNCGFDEGGQWNFEVTGSSMGKLSANWLGQFLASAQGILPKKYFAKTRRIPTMYNGKSPNDYTSLKIRFPTLKEVESSNLGRNGGGTLFMAEKSWKESKYPRNLFYKQAAKRKGVLAHTKIILGMRKPLDSSEKWQGYVYLGSHNFTQSAWGELNSFKEGPDGIRINNFEAGVLIPFKADTEEEFQAKANEMVSFIRPAIKYGPNDVPWTDVHKPVGLQGH